MRDRSGGNPPAAAPYREGGTYRTGRSPGVECGLRRCPADRRIPDASLPIRPQRPGGGRLPGPRPGPPAPAPRRQPQGNGHPEGRPDRRDRPLLAAGGGRPEGVGRARPVRRGLADRSRREHDPDVLHPGHRRRQDAAGRVLRSPHDPGREGVDGHPEHPGRRVGELQLRREGGRRPPDGGSPGGPARGAAPLHSRGPDGPFRRRDARLGEAPGLVPGGSRHEGRRPREPQGAAPGPSALRVAGLERRRRLVREERHRPRPGGGVGGPLDPDEPQLHEPDRRRPPSSRRRGTRRAPQRCARRRWPWRPRPS